MKNDDTRQAAEAEFDAARSERIHHLLTALLGVIHSNRIPDNLARECAKVRRKRVAIALGRALFHIRLAQAVGDLPEDLVADGARLAEIDFRAGATKQPHFLCEACGRFPPFVVCTRTDCPE